MVAKKILTTINNEIIDIVKDFVLVNNILELKDVSDEVFSRDGLNICVLTDVGNLYDIEALIENNASKYEDGGLGFENNILVDDKGVIGIETLITIDSGNQSTTQTALNENGFLLLTLYNYFKIVKLPDNWKLYEVKIDKPVMHPFQAHNIYSIIEIRGLYEIR